MTCPYDQNTFIGRLRHFQRITSPFSLFQTTDKLQHSISVINALKKNVTLPPHPQGLSYTKNELEDAYYIVNSTIHPDTNNPIFLPFRMASFVPTNLIVTAGLLHPNMTTRSIIFWQWLNQSVNVGFNWANANKTSPVSISETIAAYVTAVVSSVSVAVGLNSFVSKTSLLSPSVRLLASRFVPFVAVASAGSLNVILMRRNELVNGIQIIDDKNNPVGFSQIAGYQAIFQVVLSRIAISLPCLTIPPLVMSQLEKTRLFKGVHGPKLLFATNLFLIGATLTTALPVAIALFPQYGKLEPEQVEEKFRTLGSKYFIYNKGL
jgi:tricarboxylate carrier